MRVLPEHARVLLARRRIAELIRHLETLDASLAGTMSEFHGRALPSNAAEHAMKMQRLQAETDEPIAVVEQVWSEVDPFVRTSERGA